MSESGGRVECGVWPGRLPLTFGRCPFVASAFDVRSSSIPRSTFVDSSSPAANAHFATSVPLSLTVMRVALCTLERSSIQWTF